MSKRILFTEEDFKKLTKGEVIKKDDIEIALSDIGYDRMLGIIADNGKEQNHNFFL